MEESRKPYLYDPFNQNELSDFQLSINHYMEEADKCLGVTYNEGENGILSRNISKKREEISSIDRYKSEVFSNMALATTRLRAIFELIDIEIDNKEKMKNNDFLDEDFGLNEVETDTQSKKQEMKEAIYKDFKKMMESFNDKLYNSNFEGFIDGVQLIVNNIDENNLHHETKKLKNVHFDFNTKIYKVLKKNDLHQDLAKRIDILNGLQNMSFEKKTITMTLDIEKDGKKYTRIITDEPIEPFSSEMKKRINENQYTKDPWYQDLTKFQKNVFERYKKQIISGHPIPNMINFIPGIRNAFKRIDIIQDKDKKEIARASLIHTSHPTVIGNKDSKNLTKQNIDHLQKVAKRKIFLSGLITPLIFNLDEKKMHEDIIGKVKKNKRSFREVVNKFFSSSKNRYSSLQSETNEGTKKNLLSYGNIPINMFRIFYLCLFKKRAMDNLIKESLHTIINSKENPDKEASLIDKSNNITKLIEKAGNLNLDEKSQKILETIKFLDKSLNHTPRFKMLKEQFKGNNLSIEINSNFHLLIDMMNDFRVNDTNKSIPVLFCKSGKDRTGIQEEYSIAKILGNKQNVFSEQDLLKSSIESGHLRFINGSQYGGNSAGLNGVLCRPMNVHSKDYKLFKDNLYNDVAESNHFKYQKKGYIMKFIDAIINLFNKSDKDRV